MRQIEQNHVTEVERDPGYSSGHPASAVSSLDGRGDLAG